MGMRIHDNIQKLGPAHSKSSVAVAATTAILLLLALFVFLFVLFWPHFLPGQGEDWACHQRTCPSLGSHTLQLDDHEHHRPSDILQDEMRKSTLEIARNQTN